MTLETETAPPAVGSSGREGDTTTTKSHKNTSESSTINVERGRDQGGCGGRVIHQGREG